MQPSSGREPDDRTVDWTDDPVDHGRTTRRDDPLAEPTADGVADR